MITKYDPLLMNLGEIATYDQAEIDRASESIWETLFGRFEPPSLSWKEYSEAIEKGRKSYAIRQIKAQPFFNDY